VSRELRYHTEQVISVPSCFMSVEGKLTLNKFEDAVVIKHCISYFNTHNEQFESWLLRNVTIISSDSAAVVKMNMQQFEMNTNMSCCVAEV